MVSRNTRKSHEGVELSDLENKEHGPGPDVFTLKNGLTLIVEHVPHVHHVALHLVMPNAVLTDPADKQGVSIVLAELMSRGAAGRTSRELAEEYDRHGIRHSESAGLHRFHFRSAFLAEQSETALRLLADVIQKPTLSQDDLEPVRKLFLHDVRSLKDHPARWASLELQKQYYPEPFNRWSIGTEDGLEAVTIDAVREKWKSTVLPKGSVLSLSGKCEPQITRELCERVFGEWEGTAPEPEECPPERSLEHRHIEYDSAQQQLVLCFPSSSIADEDYYPMKLCSQVLSGGMFGKLFVEVREKRGLCYSVSFSHFGWSNFGTGRIYAGTTPERCDETLKVSLEVLTGAGKDLSSDELERARVNLLSALILSEESISSRSSSNASDFLLRGRVRTLPEMKEALEGVTLHQVQECFESRRPEEFSFVTIGKRDLLQEGIIGTV